jgi:cation:H+ antiporter
MFMYIAVFILGSVLLEVGADWFTDRAGELAEHAGVSETLAGLLTVGIEWEELVVVLVAALSGKPAVAAGDVIGSCIANLCGSLGIGVLARPMSLERDDRRAGLAMLGVTALVAALVWLGRGTISRPAGILLAGLFAAYLIVLLVLFRRGVMVTLLRRDDDDEKIDLRRGVAFAFLGALGGLALVILGAELVVRAAIELAKAWRISEFIVGVTLVAFGTTLPDTVINVVAARKGSGGLVIANAAGSNICNLLFSLGVAAAIAPLAIGSLAFFDLLFLLGVTTLLILALRGPRLVRAEGLALVVLYGGYLVYSFAFRGGH